MSSPQGSAAFKGEPYVWQMESKEKQYNQKEERGSQKEGGKTYH